MIGYLVLLLFAVDAGSAVLILLDVDAVIYLVRLL